MSYGVSVLGVSVQGVSIRGEHVWGRGGGSNIVYILVVVLHTVYPYHAIYCTH